MGERTPLEKIWRVNRHHHDVVRSTQVQNPSFILLRWIFMDLRLTVTQDSLARDLKIILSLQTRVSWKVWESGCIFKENKTQLRLRLGVSFSHMRGLLGVDSLGNHNGAHATGLHFFFLMKASSFCLLKRDSNNRVGVNNPLLLFGPVLPIGSLTSFSMVTLLTMVGSTSFGVSPFSLVWLS